MRKIAIALSKGGVGKTTTAVNLAAGLARQSRSVLLVDVDTQGQVSRALGCNPATGLAEVVAGEATVEQAAILAREHLWLLGGGRSLAGLKRPITRKDFGGEQTLAEGLSGADSRYDFVILDTAPGWDALSINVLFYAEEVLAPVSLEVMTLQSLIEFRRSLESIQRYRQELALTLFRGLTAERLAEYHGPLYGLFESEFGTRMIRADERIRAVAAAADVAALLSVAPGSPLLLVDRVSYTYRDQPVEVRRGFCVTTEHHYRNDLF